VAHGSHAYLREPMNCLSASSPVEEVDLMFGTQLGKTETGNNWVGYTIHVDPRR
jgi:phage terminase large subunit GpA-like protein